MSQEQYPQSEASKVVAIKKVEFRWSVSGNLPEEQKRLDVWCRKVFKHYIYQLENTGEDEKHNFHYQGFGELFKRTRPSSLKTTAISLNGQLNGIRIGVASSAGLEALKKYVMKEDTRVAGPWSDCKLYLGDDLPAVLYPWQETVKELCMETPDDRIINYIIDPTGNTGKSKFCKLMGFKMNAVVLPWGRTGDLLNLVVKIGARSIYLFDLSRTKPQDWANGDICAAMESIKNGYVVNLKYETGVFYMASPHIWCFSNSAPNLSGMSADRWRLWEISSERRLIPHRRGRRDSTVEILD